MTGIHEYYLTEGGNNQPGLLFPEGQTRSSLNNGSRQVQADLRAWYNDPGWVQYGDGNGPATVTRLTEDSFSIGGADVAAIYEAGRRIRADGTVTGTIHGTIRSSSFATDTVVEVDWDGSGVLAAEAISIWIAAASEANSQQPLHSMARPNILLNGQFVLWSLGETLTSLPDDSPICDFTRLLSDGDNVVDIAKEVVDRPTQAPASLEATVATANAKFGFLFPVEAQDATMLIGGITSMAFSAKGAVGNVGLSKLRAAVLVWTGGADLYTTDVVASWNASGIDPTLVQNWAYKNTPFDIALDPAEWGISRIPKIIIPDANGTNCALFIWVDDTNAAVGEILRLADVLFVPGPVSVPILREPISVQQVKAGGMSQALYDDLFPIGRVLGGADETAPVVPSGISATWNRVAGTDYLRVADAAPTTGGSLATSSDGSAVVVTDGPSTTQTRQSGASAVAGPNHTHNVNVPAHTHTIEPSFRSLAFWQRTA